jgi:MFS family permease
VVPLSALQVRRRYLTLLSLRWLAVGLVIPIQVLLPLSRGLTLGQVGLVFSAQGLVVLLLELPTGGLTDSWGRRPVLLVAGAVGIVASTLFYFAHTPLAFAFAAGLMGVFRALDSGPLEAWYVDATHAVEPDYRIERGLSAGSAALSIAIGVGSLTSGGLVAWNPFPGLERLAVPVLVGLLIQVAVLPITAVLMTELRPIHARTGVLAGVRGVPRVIGDGVRLLRGSRVLLGIVFVELFWGFGMPGFESLTPVRLSEILSNADSAAALMGPVGSLAWGASALGSAAALLLVRWWGLAPSAVLLRLVQGATVVVMGLVGGAVGLITAFLACYLVHGASNALHSTLLHRQVGAGQRATVVSMNSMVSQGAGAVGTLVLPAIAGGTSVQFALVIAGAALALAAPLYLPAWRADRLLATKSAGSIDD